MAEDGGGLGSVLIAELQRSLIAFAPTDIIKGFRGQTGEAVFGYLRTLPAVQQSGPPTTSNLAVGQAAVFKDTVNGNVIVLYNDGGNLTGTTLSPVTILDAHADAFSTFNLVAGPYWLMTNAWNVGTLTPTQYSDTITGFANSFPNNVVFSWKFPATPVAGNVYAYPEIVYGTQRGGFLGFPVTSTPKPTQISSFNHLALSYSMTRSFGDDDADCLIETWTFNTADRANGAINEIVFLAHTPTANKDQALGFADHFNFSAGGFNAYVSANASKSFIVIMPVTAASGTIPKDLTAGAFTINFLPILQAIVAQGWVLGTSYLCGYEFGFEVAKNAGTATINNFAWTWD